MGQINYKRLKELDEIFGTPFYIMDSGIYCSNIQKFSKAFKERYEKIIVGYSFKTNYVPALCKIAKEIGCYAEVVSEMEYSLAKRIGLDKIIFNGPIKKTASLKKALADKAILNIDSRYELDTVLEYKAEHPNDVVGVGLRLNVNLTDKEGISKVQCGLRVGRFGFSEKMMEEIIPMLRDKDIKIISLHGHTSSSDRAVANYGLITEQMLQICEKFTLNDLLYFDVGGGFFGAAAKGIDISNKPNYVDYANCILDLCLNNKWFIQIKPTIVIEPGVSVVANVFSYVSKIFQVKDITGQKFLTTDGTVFDVKPTLHKNNLPHRFYVRKNETGSFLANLVGSTCMEKDVILNNVEVPSNIGYGDYVKIEGVGAYTIALSPTFINYLSPILSIKDNNVSIIRRRQNIDDVISLYQ